MKNKFRRFFNPYYWWHLRYDISCFFRSRQHWFVKQIPRTYCDKVELVPITLFAMIVDFVEVEEGIKHTPTGEDLKYCTQEYIDSVVEFNKDIGDVYNYIKVERPDLHKQLDASYPPSGNLQDRFVESVDETGRKVKMWKSCEEFHGAPYSVIYAETNRIEELLDNKDRWALNTIIKHYKALWT